MVTGPACASPYATLKNATGAAAATGRRAASHHPSTAAAYFEPLQRWLRAHGGEGTRVATVAATPAGTTVEAGVEDLVAVTGRVRECLEAWLKRRRPDLLG